MNKPFKSVFWKVLKVTGQHHPFGGGFMDDVKTKTIYPKGGLSRHFKTRAEAEAFAVKMATKHTNSRYYVLECVFGVVYNPPPLQGKLETVTHR